MPYVRYRLEAPAEGTAWRVAVGGANRPVSRVRYRRLPGTLRVRLSLPPGLEAPLDAQGSFQRYRFSLAGGVHALPVEAGAYTLSFAEVRTPQGVWRPAPASQSVTVPSEGVGEAAEVVYTFHPYPYRLQLSIAPPPGGSGIAPKVCVFPRAPNQPPIDPNAEVNTCP